MLKLKMAELLQKWEPDIGLNVQMDSLTFRRKNIDSNATKRFSAYLSAFRRLYTKDDTLSL